MVKMSTGLCEQRRLKCIKKTGENLQLSVSNLNHEDGLRIKSPSLGLLLTWTDSSSHCVHVCPGLGPLEWWPCMIQAGQARQANQSIPFPPHHSLQQNFTSQTKGQHFKNTKMVFWNNRYLFVISPLQENKGSYYSKSSHVDR